MRRWIIHKILFWGVMLLTFAFSIAIANDPMNGFVSTTIILTIQNLVISKIYRNFVFEIIAWQNEAKTSQDSSAIFGTNSYQLILQRFQRIDK
jgi:hypothetical protein